MRTAQASGNVVVVYENTAIMNIRLEEIKSISAVDNRTQKSD